jgi:hypothetical protein
MLNSFVSVADRGQEQVDAACRHRAWARVGEVGARDSSPQLLSFALTLSLPRSALATSPPRARRS